MRKLTEKQKNILDFIEDFLERESMAPTVYEIAENFGIEPSTVFAHLRSLQQKKHLTRTSKARSIVLSRPRRKSHLLSFALPIPLLGRINAGLPCESNEFKEGEIFVNPKLLERKDAKNAFALRIQGESMRDLGIYDADIVIVKQINSGDVKNNDIVVALVDNETTVKSYFSAHDNQVELRPANTSFQSQFYHASKVTIQGKVIGLHREY